MSPLINSSGEPCWNADYPGRYPECRIFRYYQMVVYITNGDIQRDAHITARAHSSIRYIPCIHDMYIFTSSIGIPTSRAVAIVTGSDGVTRDQFYSGNFLSEKSAIVLRAAESWFRFGSYEIHAYRNDVDVLKELAHFTIENFFPEIDVHSPHRHLEWFSNVVNKTAYMVALWQSVGFTHGVCNTDNFSIMSITIDYSPFGYMDTFDQEFVPNTSDDERMYCYRCQPDVAAFNLDKLRHALVILVPPDQHSSLLYISRGFMSLYHQYHSQLFHRKLGLLISQKSEIVDLLLKMMQDMKVDFTITFTEMSQWSTSHIRRSHHGDLAQIRKLSTHDQFRSFCQLYSSMILKEERSSDYPPDRVAIMKRNNPRYVLRNWMAQRAIEDAEKGNYQTVKDLNIILSKPFTKQEKAERAGYGSESPDWAKQLKVSCSS